MTLPISVPEDAQPALDELFTHRVEAAGVRSLLDAFAFAARFPALSCYNASLVQLQRPHARFVATRSVWVRDLGRSIRPGATPIIVLRPFGPIDLLYDIADTDGARPVPEQILHPLAGLGDITETGVSTLAALITRAGVDIVQTEDASADGQGASHEDPSQEGQSQKGPSRFATVPGEISYEPGAASTIALHIRGGLEPGDELAGIISLLASALLGHLSWGHDLRTPVLGTAVPGDRSGLDPFAKAFERAAVTSLILRRARVDHPAAKLEDPHEDAEHTAAGEQNYADVSAEAVFKAVRHIEALVPRDQLLGELLRSSINQPELPRTALAPDPSPWDQPSLFHGLGQD